MTSQEYIEMVANEFFAFVHSFNIEQHEVMVKECLEAAPDSITTKTLNDSKLLAPVIVAMFMAWTEATKLADRRAEEKNRILMECLTRFAGKIEWGK